MINKEPKKKQIVNDGGVGFRVRAALTGDAPHRSGRDPLVTRFLDSQSGTLLQHMTMYLTNLTTPFLLF